MPDILLTTMNIVLLQRVPLCLVGRNVSSWKVLGDVSVMKCESESCEVLKLFCGAPLLYLPKLHRPIYLQLLRQRQRHVNEEICLPAGLPPDAMVQ